LAAVLAYLYFGAYPSRQPGNDPEGTSFLDEKIEEFQYHAMVYALAEKWAIEPLKNLALAKFTDVGAAAHKETGFLDIVEQVYMSTPEKSKIRLVAASLVKRYSTSICADDDSKSQIQEIEGLAADLALLYMNWTEDPIKHWRFGDETETASSVALTLG